MLQTVYPDWEFKKTLSHYISCMLIKSLVSSKPEVTVYIIFDWPHKLMTTLQILKYIIQQGWPKTITEVPQEIQKYWTFHEELMIEDGLILKGTRIVIPDEKREEILKQIYEGHLGLNKCQMWAKETVYWPGLNDQLEQLILNCQLCLKYSRSKDKGTPSYSFRS